MDSEMLESPAESVKDLLRAGIAAARSDERERARGLLLRVVELDDQNIQAWLWLGGVMEGLEDREAALENVLSIDTGNTAAAKGLAALRKKRVDQMLAEGIAAAQKGWIEEANQLLRGVVELDDNNLTAWLWLSRVVVSLDEMELCLENVLTLDPDNAAAQKGLAEVQRQKQIREPTFSEVIPVLAPSAEVATMGGAAALVDVAEEAPVALAEEKLDDVYGCPYCGTPTHPDDAKCPSCQADLWITFRKQEERSSWLWVALTVQLSNMVWYMVFLFLMLAAVVLLLEMEHGIEFRNPGSIVRVYFGMTRGIPPEIVDAILEAVPRLAFFAFLVPALVSGGILVGLYLRFKPIYYIFLANSIYTVVLAMASVLNNLGVAGLCSGSGLLFPIVLLVAAFQMRDDFFLEKRRIPLRTDPDVSGGLGYLVRGRDYAKRKMWAMAAIHLQRAAGQASAGIEGHVWLALSYIEMGRYDSAERSLAEARRIDPQDSRIADVAGLLAERRRVGD